MNQALDKKSRERKASGEEENVKKRPLIQEKYPKAEEVEGLMTILRPPAGKQEDYKRHRPLEKMAQNKRPEVTCAMGDADGCACARKSGGETDQRPLIQAELAAIKGIMSSPKPLPEVKKGMEEVAHLCQMRKDKATVNHARSEKIRRDMHRERVQLLKALVPGGYAARNQIEVMDLAIEYICMLSNVPSPLLEETRHGMHMATLRNLSCPSHDRNMTSQNMIPHQAGGHHQSHNTNVMALNNLQSFSPAVMWKGFPLGPMPMDQSFQNLSGIMGQLQQPDGFKKE